jgi:drug/metabolite transporter (DMT)-like permease
MQWVILAVVMTSMSVYSTAGGAKAIDPKYYNLTVEQYVEMQAKQDADSGIDSEYLIGVSFVVFKVVISCLGAVLADKYMKDYKDIPIYIQLVQFKVTWLPMTILYTFFDGETWVHGPLTGWNSAAIFVLASFTVKFWATMYLLAILDSVLKNIGEASSVLVTFFLSIFVFGKTNFEVTAFLMVVAVTLSVVSYIESKPVVDKAKKYDEALASD